MKWNDRYVKDFCKCYAKGQYGLFKNCPKMQDKLERYKKIRDQIPDRIMVSELIVEERTVIVVKDKSGEIV